MTLNYGGTAIFGQDSDHDDYSLASLEGFPGTLSALPPGGIKLRVFINGDRIDEPNETATVALERSPTTPADVVISSSAGSVTLTIVDDDPTIVSLARTGSTGGIEEGETVAFTVTLGRTLIAGEIIDAPLTVSGTNITTADWSLAPKSGSSLNTGINAL